MNTKFSLALSAAILLTGSAFAADALAPNTTASPDKMLPSATAPAVSQTADAKDATTSTTTTQETTTTTATDGKAAGDAQTTETSTETNKVKETETQSQAAPAVESSTTGTSTAATQTTTTAGQPNNVQKLFHMLQHNNQPQTGATSPEAQPGAPATTGAGDKPAQ